MINLDLISKWNEIILDTVDNAVKYNIVKEAVSKNYNSKPRANDSITYIQSRICK
jgi:hypothetical protein